MPKANKDIIPDAALVYVGAAIWAILAAWLVVRVVTGNVDDDTFALGVVVAIPASWVALVAVHELGHLFAGLAMRIPFLGFAFGPMRVCRVANRLRVRMNFADANAYVVFAWPGGRGMRLGWAAMAFAGPLANFLIAAACIAYAGPVRPGQGIAFPLLRLAAAFSVLLGASQLVPFWYGTLRSDGGQLLDLARGVVPTITNKRFLREWAEVFAEEAGLEATPAVAERTQGLS